jgi:macrolide-specific efflux system membrane fusion protein
VPSDAVKHREGKTTVLVPGTSENEAPQERPVKTGLSDGKRVEIIEGVIEGEKLLAARMKAVSAKGGESKGNPLTPFRRR